MRKPGPALSAAPALLVDMAQRNPSFSGIGMDANRSMCAQARAAVRRAGLEGRIEIRYADGANPNQYLSRSLRAKVDGLHGGSFLNEFFGEGELNVVKLLRALRRSFPGRKAWFVDYYSSLGQSKRKGCSLISLSHCFKI